MAVAKDQRKPSIKRIFESRITEISLKHRRVLISGVSWNSGRVDLIPPSPLYPTLGQTYGVIVTDLQYQCGPDTAL